MQDTFWTDELVMEFVNSYYGHVPEDIVKFKAPNKPMTQTTHNAHVITADIRGFKYYAQTQWEKHDCPTSLQGLKNNATIFTDKNLAEATRASIKCKWPLKVEAY